LLLLLSLWRCGQGDSLVHHIHGPPGSVGLGRRLAVVDRMWPLGIVKIDPIADDLFGLEPIRQLVQIDRLVFERALQPLDEDVVHAAAPAIHGDRNLRRLEQTGEVKAGELAALVGVEDLRFSISG